MPSEQDDWTRPRAIAIPREGYFTYEKGIHGPVFPRTPACHGFTIIAKLKAGREASIWHRQIHSPTRPGRVKCGR